MIGGYDIVAFNDNILPLQSVKMVNQSLQGLFDDTDIRSTQEVAVRSFGPVHHNQL